MDEERVRNDLFACKKWTLKKGFETCHFLLCAFLLLFRMMMMMSLHWLIHYVAWAIAICWLLLAHFVVRDRKIVLLLTLLLRQFVVSIRFYPPPPTLEKPTTFFSSLTSRRSRRRRRWRRSTVRALYSVAFYSILPFLKTKVGLVLHIQVDSWPIKSLNVGQNGRPKWCKNAQFWFV